LFLLEVIIMAPLRSLIILAASISTAVATVSCPFGYDGPNPHTEGDNVGTLESRDAPAAQAMTADNFLQQFTINSTDDYLTSDAGGPIEDQNSLTAGDRGPTLLEDFIFRQKITHFDHERVGSSAI
jgi:catalase